MQYQCQGLYQYDGAQFPPWEIEKTLGLEWVGTQGRIRESEARQGDSDGFSKQEWVDTQV